MCPIGYTANEIGLTVALALVVGQLAEGAKVLNSGLEIWGSMRQFR